MIFVATKIALQNYFFNFVNHKGRGQAKRPTMVHPIILQHYF
jgi:hypothetical protein